MLTDVIMEKKKIYYLENLIIELSLQGNYQDLT